MHSRKATNTNFSVWLDPRRIEPTIYCTQEDKLTISPSWGAHLPNTTEIVRLIIVCHDEAEILLKLAVNTNQSTNNCSSILIRIQYSYLTLNSTSSCGPKDPILYVISLLITIIRLPLGYNGVFIDICHATMPTCKFKDQSIK